MGKLGAKTRDATAAVIDIAAFDAGGDVVNGPEDLPDWEAIDWHDQEEQVQRLRQRIFKATQAEDHKQVRNLQKLMLRSRANTLVSVRRVSQHNTGRHTAGVDRQVAVTSPSRAALAMRLHHQAGLSHALPVRRVYIPKKRRETPTRDSSHRRPRPAATGAQRAGTRVGGTARPETVRVPAGPRMSRRDRDDP